MTCAQNEIQHKKLISKFKVYRNNFLIETLNFQEFFIRLINYYRK